MKYPNRIKELRLRAGLDQKDFYIPLGWGEDRGQSRFSLLENGKRKLTLSVAQVVADILHVTPLELETPPGRQHTPLQYMQRSRPDQTGNTEDLLFDRLIDALAVLTLQKGDQLEENKAALRQRRHLIMAMVKDGSSLNVMRTTLDFILDERQTR